MKLDLTLNLIAVILMGFSIWGGAGRLLETPQGWKEILNYLGTVGQIIVFPFLLFLVFRSLQQLRKPGTAHSQESE